MWLEVASEIYWKTAASLSVFAVAVGHLALLSTARLAQGFRWSLVAAYVIILGVASLIVSIILFENDNTHMFRLLGVCAVVDAAITSLIPIFHWFSRAERSSFVPSTMSPSLAEIDAEIATLKSKLRDLERLRGQAAQQMTI
jgi:hypothetical protein